MSLKAHFIIVIESVLPFAAAPIFFTVISGRPSIWAAWVIALIPWVLYFCLNGRFRRTPFDIPIIIFILGLLVGLLVSPNKTVSAGGLYTTFACILIYYGLVNNSSLGRAYWLTLAAMAGIIVLGMTAWYFSQGEARYLWFNDWLFKLMAALPKTTGPVLQIHSIGMLLAVIVPLPAAIALHHDKTWLRWAVSGTCILLLGLVFLTASGSAWIATVCGLIFVLASWRLWTIGLTLPVIGVSLAIITINYHQLSWPAHVFSTGSLLGRIDLWQKTLPLLNDSIITGMGLGAWSELFEKHYGTYSVNVHNSYIQLYADTGILGVIAAVVASVVLVKLSRRILVSVKQSPWYGVGIGIIAGVITGAAGSIFEVIITGAFKTTHYYYMGIPLLWIWAALLVVSYQRVFISLPCITGKQGLLRINTLK